LSRPGLDLVSRELSIVAFLMAENRTHQLHSHMRGALHVGATIEQLGLVVDDFGEAAGDGYRSACAVLERLKDDKCDG
ncbi:MAG: carboxymuconolactone decarboxylase family protein, partial [Candidatus Zixiibacteriota bacterium]